MLAKRMIPCLDVKAGRVVKGVRFQGLRDAGDPVELAGFYSKEGADELYFWILQQRWPGVLPWRTLCGGLQKRCSSPLP